MLPRINSSEKCLQFSNVGSIDFNMKSMSFYSNFPYLSYTVDSRDQQDKKDRVSLGEFDPFSF